MTTPHLPPTVNPREPEWQAMDLIHRGSDGVITIHTNVDKQWKDLCAIPANCLPQLFPQLIPDIERESFFSINAMSRAKHGCGREYLDEQGKPLPFPRRRKEWVRYITAAFADIDCYKVRKTVGEIVGSVIDMQRAGIIPPPSIIMLSGNGVWLLWLLAGKNGKLYGGFPDKLAAYEKVQRAIQEKFAVYGSDIASKDVARITRIPGSLNCKKPDAPKRVDYLPQINAATGNVNTYTLEELAAWLQVDLKHKRPRRFSQSTTGNPILIERGRKGQAGRWQSAYEQFERLWEMRGTWKPGTRNGAVFILAAILNAKKDRDLAAVRHELDELFADLERGEGDDLYSRDEFEKAVQAAGKGKTLAGMSDQYIADRLEVTPGESAALQSFTRERGWKGLPPALKWQEGNQLAAEPRLTARQRRDRRRKLIHDLATTIFKGKGIPPLGRIAEYVNDAGLGLHSEATIMRDLKSLGIANPRKWQGRKSADQTKPLPFAADP